MIVAEFDVIRIAILEAKADTPLLVHGDRMLSHTIVFERVQPISRRHAEVEELSRHVDRLQFSEGATRHVPRNALRFACPEELLSRAVRECLDHSEV